MQNETTRKWTYFDGTEMTYFNWANGEPNDRYEGHITTAKFVHYMWHDAPSTSISAAVCELTP